MTIGDRENSASYALIVATDQYVDTGLSKLKSPTRDAQELANVLGDPTIGNYHVRALVNKSEPVVSEEIEGFFAKRRLDDLVVFYYSGHGLKDLTGHLYFAATTTKLDRLASTGISAGFLFEQVERCRSRKIVLLLDCCYSGAYLRGYQPRTEGHIPIEPPEGRGWVVITSSTAQEYAFEPDSCEVTRTAQPSVFTTALVKGLRTGKADRDHDGFVSIDELYAYIYEQVRDNTRYQTPEKKFGNIRGDLIVAKNPHAQKAAPELLPVQLSTVLESPLSYVREGAVRELVALLRGTNRSLALSARKALEALRDDDSRRVSAAATAALMQASEYASKNSETKIDDRRREDATTGTKAEPMARTRVGTRLRDVTTQVMNTITATRIGRWQNRDARSGAEQNYNAGGFNRGLAVLAYLLPIVALIAIFRRNSFVRTNAIQAVILVAIGFLLPAVTIGPAYRSHGTNLVPAVSQPWFGILIAVGITALCVSAVLILYCIFRVIQGRQPRVVFLTRISCLLSGRKAPKEFTAHAVKREPDKDVR